MNDQELCLAKVGKAIKRAEDFLNSVDEEWTSQEQIDLANDDLELYNALRKAIERHEPKMLPTGSYPYGSDNQYESEQCSSCRTDFPCPTITAIAKELGVGE